MIVRFPIAVCLALLLTPVTVADTSDEELIVFVQPEASDLPRQFTERDLPKLEALTDAMGLAFRVVDVGHAGAPEEVTITPLIVYQNYRGRSIYQGRYRTLDRVRNFVRTARVLPQGDELLWREHTPVWQIGRAKVATPIKITPLAGTPPAEFDADAFNAEMTAAVVSGLKSFIGMGRVALGRGDRMFYIDFYPYRSEDGTLSVGTAIFSQFHCHEPVFTKMDEPFTGPWGRRGEVFADAAAMLEEKIVEIIRSSELGDGFDAVLGTTVTSWEDLGLTLPPKPEGRGGVDAGEIELAMLWTVDTDAQAERPPVQFQFPAPLEIYSGQAIKLTGHVNFGENLALADATGKFVVEVTSITMGEPDLDREIHNNMLDAEKHPASSFTFNAIRSERDTLIIGQIIPATLVGEFTMKGIAIPLEVPVTMEVFLGDDGRPRLSIDGRWEIRLHAAFDIRGPDGPAPANDTLVYLCHIVLEPTD